jgi:hypothetical protein
MTQLIGGVETRPARRLVEAASGQPTLLARASIRHRRGASCIAQVVDQLTSPGDVAIVLLVGPSRVGKTHLLEQITAQVRHMLRKRPALPAHHDVVALQAPGAKAGRYPWTALAGSINLELNAPPFRLSTPPEWQDRPRWQTERLRGADDPGALEMAASWIAGCEVQLVVLNEAVNLMPALQGRYGPEHLHKLKDLVQRSAARWLLVGTEALEELPSLSPELAGRCAVVRFAPYRADDEQDRREFTRVTGEFLSLLKRPMDLDEALLDDVMAATRGCVGALRNWLVDAEALASRKRCDLLRAMRDTRPPVAAVGVVPAPPRRKPQPPVTLSGQQLRPGERRPAKPDLLTTEVAHV